MKKIKLFGPIDVNCYIIEDDGKCYIVDPGYEKDKLVEFITKNNLSVLGILLTHAHMDHIGVVDAFDVPVFLYKEEIPLFYDIHNNGYIKHGQTKKYLDDDINLVGLEANDILYLNDKKLHVIHTPGHTAGSVCYKIDNKILTGDTLFKETVGKWTLHTGDKDKLKESIINLIDYHEDHIEIYPAHGYETTIGHERENNRYYLDWNSENNEYYS